MELPLQCLTMPTQVVISLGILAHLDACAYGYCLYFAGHWRDTEVDPLDFYYECFGWTFNSIVNGLTPRHKGLLLVSFEVFMYVQRLLLIGAMAFSGGVYVLRFQEYARFKVLKEGTLSYLRKHRVGAATQIQVLRAIQETRHAALMRNQCKELKELALPLELKHRISEELWSASLLSMELIMKLEERHGSFVASLSRVVHEVFFAAKAVLFREGDRCEAAYYILTGLVEFNSTIRDEPFESSETMWIGEKALVNPLLRRSATALAKCFVNVLEVLAADFQRTVAESELGEYFKHMCEYQVPFGLCGQCGGLGDHFTDVCPYAQKLRREGLLDTVLDRVGHMATLGGKTPDGNPRTPKERLIFAHSKIAESLGVRRLDGDKNPQMPASALRRAHTAQALRTSQAPPGRKSGRVVTLGKSITFQELPWLEAMSLELHSFLRQHDLEHIGEQLVDLGLKDLEALEGINEEQLATLQLAELEQAQLRPHAIKAFRAKSGQLAKKLLHGADSNGSGHHIFLSHCKLDAGTEACLLRSELQEAIALDPEMADHGYAEPVFLDSEDLQDLRKLGSHVRQSCNLVVLLTTNLLTRPWCLVEIYTAVKAGVTLVPVQVVKPGNDFNFPTEAFYAEMSRGSWLDEAGRKTLKDSAVPLDGLVKTVRELFKRIAVTYSPHQSKMIRQAEVNALLIRCKHSHG